MGNGFSLSSLRGQPGEEHAIYHTDTVRFTKEEFCAKLELKLNGAPKSWIGTATYTAGDGISTMVIGGRTFSGTELRAKLGLRSTAFSMEADEEGILVTTHGFGHRVGLSQYGADAMAMAGHSWQEILTYYYTGATLELTNVPG